MPDMDGYETAAMIRQRKSSRHTPIIFVTAYGQEDTQIAQSYALGAVDFVQTPIVPEILRAKVGVFVDLYKKSRELTRIAEEEHRRQLGEAREKLEAETKRNLFFTMSLDLLAVVGFDGRLRQTNAAWEKALDHTAAELTGKEFLDLTHPDDRDATREQWQKLQLGEPIQYFENRVLSKSGSLRWLGWTAAPLVAEQLVYIFARDVTARRLADDEIRVLNHKLRQHVEEVTAINRELETFNYSISHDLRAPLRSMQGFAQILETEYGHLLPEEALEYTSRIIESSQYMDRLLHDLLDYSRLSQHEIRTGPVNVETILEEVLHQFQSEITERNARIDVTRPLATAIADTSTLKQILSNLISNALKFVKGGQTPNVHIYTEAKDGHVRLWVEDSGIGIEQEHREKIFGLFNRLHGAEEFPGTGIGLAIVRKGAQRMGAHVGVESEVGAGSRFWVEMASPEAEKHEKKEHLVEA